MGHPRTDIGSQLVHTAGLAPIALSAGASNGGAINRLDALSCKLICSVGAATGTPTSFTVITKLQDSADGSTGWADYVNPPGSTVATAPTVLADDTESSLNVNLASAKKFIRTVTTVAFVDGTTPAIVTAPAVILGGYGVEPAVAA